MEKRLQKAPMLETQRLVLHPFHDSDLEDAMELLYNDEIKKTFMLPDFPLREDAEKMFDALKNMSDSQDHFVYGIYYNEKLIGFINDVEIDGPIIEIGYVIHPKMQNQGYATEMLLSSIEELFRIGYLEIRAGFFEENQASRRVMEKSGMKPIPYTTDIEYRGKRHHCIYYAVTAPQFFDPTEST